MATPLAEMETWLQHGRANGRVARVAGEIGIFLGAILVYFSVRSLTEGSRAQAIENARDLVRFQDWLGIGWETTMQSWIEGSQTMITLANWAYIYGHWPFIAIVGVWLMWAHPHDYRLTRNAFLISGGIGMVIFAFYPVAPPRLLDLGLVDTVTEHSHAYRVLQPPAFTNQYAALPSLHFGWNLLIGIALVRVSERWWVELIGWLSPVIMFFATILTANHFIIDAIAGAIVALTGLAAAVTLRRWRSSKVPVPGTA